MSSPTIALCQQSVDADVPASFAWQYMTNVSNWSDPPAEFSLETMQQFIDWNRSSPYKVERGEGECAI